MAFHPGYWLRENTRVYFGNAMSVRDYRSQLRGNRPIWLWGAYLGVLTGIVGLAYAGIVESSSVSSVAMAQSRLANFYQTVIALLATAVSLMAPALTAMTIVGERQNRSLDLVFSTPVSLKYYLVGKMLSGLRYTWMLLALALPVAAVCVVMGGATWGDVLGAYLLLASSALVFTGFGLLMSALSKNPTAAVVGTYGLVFIYCSFTGIFGSIGMGTRMMGGTTTLEASWLMAVNPFMAGLAAPTYTLIWGVAVPNWIPVALYALLLTKLLVLGTASVMTHYGSSESKSFRLHGLVYTFLLAWIGAGIGSGVAAFGGMVSGGGAVTAAPSYLGLSGALISVFYALYVPTMAAYTFRGNWRSHPDGWFNLRNLLLGTPGSALPYMVALVVAIFTGVLASSYFNGSLLLDASPLWGFVWSLSFLILWWGIARFYSMLTDNLTASRVLTVATLLSLLCFPPIAIGGLYSMDVNGEALAETLWPFYILYPVGSPQHLESSVVHSSIMLAVGLLLGFWSERNAKRFSERLGVTHESVAR